MNATQEQLKYLDELRERGVTNMYGARPFVMDEFPTLTEKEAGVVVAEWMQTFSKRHGLEDAP